jgi:hypothetical protein
MTRYKKPADFDCILGGKEWRIQFVTRRKLPKLDGICYWDDRLILIRYDQPADKLLDALIHECQHALSEMHFAAEKWIEQTSTELSIAILRTGYGKKDG